jgi:hypothetical protein
MPTEPQQPQGTRGVIHIVREARAGNQARPSDFSVSFGGKKDGVGAFYLGKATGIDLLIKLLEKIGLSHDEIDVALQVLTAQQHHEIPNVTLTHALIRKLGL